MRRFRPFQVRLPSGDRYWTVVDLAYRPVAEADEWLLHVRLGRDCAESTTEAYARSLGLFWDWCAATGLDWRQAPGQFGRFVYWLQRYDPDPPAYAQVRVVRGPRRVNAVLAAVREFFRHAVATGLADKAVLDALFDLAEDYDLPADVRGDRAGLRLREQAAAPATGAAAGRRRGQRRGSPGAAAGVPQRPGPVHRAGIVADRAPPRRADRGPARGRSLRAGRHPAGLPGQGSMCMFAAVTTPTGRWLSPAALVPSRPTGSQSRAMTSTCLSGAPARRRGAVIFCGQPVPGAVRRADAPESAQRAAGGPVAAGRAAPRDPPAPAPASWPRTSPRQAGRWMRSASCSVTPRSPPARCTCIPHPTGSDQPSTASGVPRRGGTVNPMAAQPLTLVQASLRSLAGTGWSGSGRCCGRTS